MSGMCAWMMRQLMRKTPLRSQLPERLACHGRRWPASRAHVIEQGPSIAAPPRIVISQRPVVTAFASKLMEDAQGWREQHGPVAPRAEPAVATEDANLHIEGESRAGSSGGSQGSRR